jgi:hypothetical protein
MSIYIYVYTLILWFIAVGEEISGQVAECTRPKS